MIIRTNRTTYLVKLRRDSLYTSRQVVVYERWPFLLIFRQWKEVHRMCTTDVDTFTALDRQLTGWLAVREYERKLTRPAAEAATK